MTGYGCAKETVNGLIINVELKSVNNKYLETSVRLPRNCLCAEDGVKNVVAGHISRGKVDVFINIDSSGADDIDIVVNENLLKAYITAFGKIHDDFGLPFNMNALDTARLPDVLSEDKKEIDKDAVSQAICLVAEKALTDFDRMRIREGNNLKLDILSKLSTIESLVSTVEEKSPETVEAYRNRLYEKMTEVLGSSGVDENRIVAEAAVFADHIAVDEETVRLRSHIEQLKSMLETGSPIGRKMDFLVQEFNREANTIGSKCQNSEIAHTVVDLKSEIEKIREQIQNIE